MGGPTSTWWWARHGWTLAAAFLIVVATGAAIAQQNPQRPASADSAARDSVRRSQAAAQAVRDSAARDSARDSTARAARDSAVHALQDSITRQSALRRARREQLGAWGATAGSIAFGTATLLSLLLFLMSLARGEVIEMETNWGGIGGGLGGWRFSRSLTQLLAVLALAGMFSASVWMLLREPSPAEKPAAKPPAVTAPDSGAKTR